VKKILFAFSGFIFLLCQVFSALTTWESLSVCMFIYFFLEFLNDLGTRIVMLDLAIILAVFTCLVMPVIFYHEYGADYFLARLWDKYMPISSEGYFSFAVPAVFLMILGIRFPLGKLGIKKNPEIYIENTKKYLASRPNLGLILISVGVTSGLLDFLSPSSLKQVFYLMDHLTYVGVFYVLYSPNKRKRYIVPGVLALMLGQTIITGMFGELIYMLALSLMLILLGKKIRFSRKLLFAAAGIFVIVIIQSIKVEYRKRNWTEGVGADPAYFSELIAERITNPSVLFDPDKLFFLAVRLNQGWLIAVTMDRVPKNFSFANGETIWQSVAASFVPRVLWPDKPEAGGHVNIKRFWGVDLKAVSMNLGPIGEAYANFDRTGGIIYMFFYGLFLNIVLSVILKLADRRPTLVLWLPVLFLYAVVVEGDLLMVMNWLLKGTFFTWVVFKIFRNFFRIDL
jgi:hypothetical protein